MNWFEKFCLAVVASSVEARAKERGAALVEYALLVVAISIVVAAAVILFGSKVTAYMSTLTL